MDTDLYEAVMKQHITDMFDKGIHREEGYAWAVEGAEATVLFSEVCDFLDIDIKAWKKITTDIYCNKNEFDKVQCLKYLDRCLS